MKHAEILILLSFIFSFTAAAQHKKQPALKLTARQMKALDRKLPLKVRNFLETADKLEIIADTKMADERVYQPDTRFEIKNRATRKKVLYFFYRDLALGGNGAACFYPHHSIIARKGDKTVKIVICFTCHEFVVSGAFGEWDGGMWGEPKAEDLMNGLIRKFGVPIK